MSVIRKTGCLMVALLLFMTFQTLWSGGQQEAKPTGPTELEVWHRWSGARQELLHNIIEGFNTSQSDITVKEVNVGGLYAEIVQKAIAQMAAGDPPPDMLLAGYQDAPFVRSELGTTDMEDLVEKAELNKVLETFVPSALDLVRLEGKIIGLPYAFSTPVMYYNADLFKEAGLDPDKPPKTWAEFTEMSRQIKQKTGKYGGYIHSITDWSYLWMVASAGGKTEVNGKPAFNTKEGMESLYMWNLLYQEELIPNVNNQEGQVAFTSGNAAMLWTTIMRLGNIQETSDFDVRTTKLPAFGSKQVRGPAGGAEFLVLARDKNRKKACWTFIQYMISEKSINEWSQTGYLSPLKSGTPVNPLQQAAYDTLIGLVPWSYWPGKNDPEIRKQMGNMREMATTGNAKDIPKIVEEMVNTINSLLP